jgi:hypothetical protein
MFDGGSGGAHRGNGGQLALYHGIQDICRVPEINIRVPWTQSLRIHEHFQNGANRSPNDGFCFANEVGSI